MTKRMTARDLVLRELGEKHLGRRRLRWAIVCFHLSGWQLAYCPSSDEPDRVVKAVRQTHPLADVRADLRRDAGAAARRSQPPTRGD
jgi:hypothetical protein